MKYLILLVLALTACSTAPKQEEFLYECDILTMHGVQGRLKGTATSEVEATRQVQQIRDNYVAKGLMPDNTFVKCFRTDDDSQPTLE